MPIASQHAEAVGTAEVAALAVDQLLQLVEHAAVTHPGSMLAGTPDASGKTIGLALSLPFSG